jgi:hypothetical protein
VMVLVVYAEFRVVACAATTMMMSDGLVAA